MIVCHVLCFVYWAFFMCLRLRSMIAFCVCVPCELFVSCFVHGDSYVDIGCKKLNNLVVHAIVLFQSASNSDTEVNHEKNNLA